MPQVGLPVIYDGMKIDLGYRLDLLVEDSVIVELKAVNEITPIHEAGAAFIPQTKWKTPWTAN